MTTNRNELLKLLAECCYIWPKGKRPQEEWPNIMVAEGFGVAPSIFFDLGGEYYPGGDPRYNNAWYVRDDKAISLMYEIRPLVNNVRRRAIDTWLRS